MTQALPSRTRASIIALAISFLIYAIPLLGPHAVFLLGEVLLDDLSGRSGRHPFAWVAADWGVALAAQFLLGAAVYVVHRRHPRLTIVAVVALAPAFVFQLDRIYLVTLPAHFLIEEVTAQEKSLWPQACVAEDAMLADTDATQTWALAQAGMVAVRTSATGWGVMRVPGCAVTPIEMPAGSQVNLISITSSGQGLASEWVNQEARNRYWYVEVGKHPALIEWLRADSPPILGSGGHALAWIHSAASEIRLQQIDGSGSRSVSLEKLMPSLFTLLAFDAQNSELLLAKRLDEYLGMDLDGNVRWGPLRPDGIAPQPQTFLRVDAAGHWFGWDAIRDEEPYRIRWSLANSNGSYTVPRGRAINNAAVDERGEYVAYSVTNPYNIGNVSDAVVAISTHDNSEVFRKNLRIYTRTHVAFLQGGYFVYSDVDGTRGFTHALRIPSR